MLDLQPIVERLILREAFLGAPEDTSDDSALDRLTVTDLRSLIDEVKRLRAAILLHEQMRDAEMAGCTTADHVLWGLVGIPATHPVNNGRPETEHWRREYERLCDYIGVMADQADPQDVRALAQEALNSKTEGPVRRDRHDVSILSKIRNRGRFNA